MRTFKYLTVFAFMLFSGILVFMESPKGVYLAVKGDLLRKGIDLPAQYIEVVRTANLGGSAVGYSLDMNAYSKRSVCIVVDRAYWNRMDMEGRKKLILHESMHSLFDIHHSKEPMDIMYPSINYVKYVPYQELLDCLVETLIEKQNAPKRYGPWGI